MLKFWVNVKDELEYNMMTQKQLAAAVKISYNTLQSWINKDRLPNAEHAVMIAKTLNTSVEYLITGKHSQNSFPQNRHIITDLKQKIDNIFDEYLMK